LWYAPTILWLSAGNHMLIALAIVGMFASLLLVANIWPRAMLLLCFIGFLSFVGAAQDFANYQSDGMLLEAGFISIFLAPGGLLPGWGATSPPPRAGRVLSSEPSLSDVADPDLAPSR
jgi:lipase maturation factor 1